MNAPTDRPARWGLALGLLAVVTVTIFGLGKVVPFEPSSDTSAAAGGDATRGAARFATACAGCHGAAGGGGGIGPTLAGVPRQADGIAAVIAAGKGAMPAGLVTGTDAADVVAYVVSIGGGDSATATTGTAPTGPAAGTEGGTATLTGRGLTGLRIQLDEPAPEGWSVWIDGSTGVRRVSAIAADARSVTVNDAGLDSLADGTDAVLVGASAEAPALRGEVPGGLQELLVSSQSPGEASLVTAAAGQVDVLDDHIRFLRKALDERNLANVRFHSEHLLNISRGDPLVDADENGEASNPGDGIGLVGQPDRDGYLPRILAVGGPDLVRADALTLTVTGIARSAQQCAADPDFESGPCIAVLGRQAELRAGWRDVAADARGLSTIPLVATG